MHIAHHPVFVALSIVIACLGSWTALDLFRRVRAHIGHTRTAWLAAAATAMGFSIWSMHFIAMLGFDPGTEVRYDIGLTLLSLILAIAATAFAFFVVVEPRPTRLVVGGVVMGAGICIMHYAGMAAVITQATIQNDPRYVAMAFVVAVTASSSALIVPLRERSFAQRALAAVVLGFAIVGMHYTAMFGVRLTPAASSSLVQGGADTLTLAFGVAISACFILFLGLIAALSDRRFEALAAQEASRSEQHLRAMIENLPFGVFMAAAPSGEVRFANAEAQRLLGHSLEGSTVWSGKAPEYGAVRPDGSPLSIEEYALHQAMREGKRIGPRIQPYRRGDGAIVQLEVTAAPIATRGRESPLVVVAFQDVTAKLSAEEENREAAALRESEATFRQIAEQAPVMLWITDTRGLNVYANQALRDFWGIKGDIASFDWASTLLVNNRAEVLSHIEQARAKHESFEVEAQLRRVDGAARTVLTKASPRFNARGEFIGMVGVNVDVTEARQAQSDLLRINELLEERVAAALAEKAAAEDALVHAQRLEAMGRLTGGVAHDFNNLLTVVIGALDIILRHPEDARRRTQLGEAALAAARRGERLTAQLLAFARRQRLKPEVCDLNDLIRVGEPLIRRALGEGRSLELKLGEQLVLARIDPAQFEGALLNLVVNAVDATPPDGKIKIETGIHALSHGEFPNLAAGQYFCLRVSDNGQGMSAEVINHIFEPFYTTKAPGKGTGLGLSQVYGFVRQSGGELRVHSRMGEGSTFTIFLPMLDANGMAVDTPTSAVPARLNGAAWKVLLAEDDPAVAKVTESMLRDMGHQVTRAENAQQALEALQSQDKFDVLLSDVVMPGEMNGVELARRAVDLRPGIKVLLVSGYAGETVEKEIADSAWPFLKKPYLEDELAARLHALTS